ncbi:hypothetical protein K7H91_23430 [Martelella mediterranea]|uniref:hypothetical protein n=1 Tax=Martelella mediterranea TaxID=293089 RepID=UPI001E6251F9|nr:hypothetical protein [Martelella mediterranea]MCD1636710.1 hypothetical protein [Martelella mediterranea]
MAATQQPNAEDGSLGRDLLYALRYYLGGRRSLLLLATVALIGGLAFNWSWLAAAGIAPLILSVLPCVAMCALGLCMNRMTGRACQSDQAASTTDAGDETALSGGSSQNLLPDDVAGDAQTARVVPSFQHSQPQSNPKRRTTDA